jgi:5-methylcytosine-specific restriction protein A
VTGFSREVRQLVQERAGYENGYIVCEIQACCQGRAVALYELHHRRARGMGSSRRPETNQAANSLAICRDCHSFAESQRETALRNGWLVRQNQTPADVPVLYRHRWMILSNDGSVTPADCVCGEVGSGGWYPGPCSCVEGA